MVKIIKKKFTVLSVFILILTAYAATAEAKVTIVVHNNRSHNVSLAFCWEGMNNFFRKGWYIVEPGQTKNIVIKDVVYALTSENFGFYATSKTAKGKKTEWRGDWKKVMIHPTKAFSGNIEKKLTGGEYVWFRKIKLKKNGDSKVDCKAVLTFKP